MTGSGLGLHSPAVAGGRGHQLDALQPDGFPRRFPIHVERVEFFQHVEAVDDLSRGSADLPPTDGLRFRLADGARVVVRPSGTEPKIKCYLEVVVPVADRDVDAARISAAGRLDALGKDVRAATGL